MSEEDAERVRSYGDTVEERARAFSPMFNIRPGQPPCLLMHGTEDLSVPVEQARRFAELYTEAGNRCELVILEDIAHAFVLVNYTAPEEVVIDAIRRGDRFLSSLGYLEGEPTLAPPMTTPFARHIREELGR
jgi:acetyl esterase/lipase